MFPGEGKVDAVGGLFPARQFSFEGNDPVFQVDSFIDVMGHKYHGPFRTSRSPRLWVRFETSTKGYFSPVMPTHRSKDKSQAENPKQRRGRSIRSIPALPFLLKRTKSLSNCLMVSDSSFADNIISFLNGWSFTNAGIPEMVHRAFMIPS